MPKIKCKSFVIPKKLTKKPLGFQMDAYHKLHKNKSFTRQEFCDLVSNGQLDFRDACYQGSSHKDPDYRFRSSELWTIDIDGYTPKGGDKRYIHPDTFIEWVELIGLPKPHVMYWTLSANPSEGKYMYRAIWFTDKIEDPNTHLLVLAAKERLIPFGDKGAGYQCKPFLPGKEMILSNLDSKALSMEEILKPIDIKEFEAGLEKKLTNSHLYQIYKELQYALLWASVSKNLRPAYTNALEFQGYLNGRGYCEDGIQIKEEELEFLSQSSNKNIAAFFGGEKLLHDDLMVVVYNLSFVEGGKELFLDQMIETGVVHEEGDTFNYSQSKYDLFDRMNWKRHLMNQRYPIHYSGVSDEEGKPLDIFEEIKEMYQSSIDDTDAEEVEVTLEEAEAMLDCDLLKLHLSGEGEGCLLVKAPCGLGKSYKVLKFLAENNIKFLYATPTTALKQELFEMFTSFGGSGAVRESLEFQDMEIRSLFSDYLVSGQVKRAYAVALDDSTAREILYRRGAAISESCNGVFVSHKFLTTTEGERMARDRVLVIDEDPINTLINAHQISNINLLRKLVSVEDPDMEIVKEYITNAIQTGMAISPINDGNMTSVGLRTYAAIRLNKLDEKEFGALISRDALVYSKGTSRKYDVLVAIDFLEQYTPLLGKAIILSANDTDVVLSRLPITLTCIKIPNVKLEGLVYRVKPKSPSTTYSRAEVEANIDEMIKIFPEAEAVITFKASKDALTERGYGHLTEHGMHFGNTEGKNLLRGKHVMIAGDCREHPSAYVSLYSAIFKKAVSMHCGMKRVTYRGLKWKDLAYTDKDLRDLCYYRRFSVIEQAIGRARALREPTARVLIYTRLPVQTTEKTKDTVVFADAEKTKTVSYESKWRISHEIEEVTQPEHLRITGKESLVTREVAVVDMYAASADKYIWESYMKPQLEADGLLDKALSYMKDKYPEVYNQLR